METPSTKKKGYLLFLNNFLIGGSSETICKMIIAPIERIKILLQTQHVLENLDVKYKGTFDCFTRIIKDQGFFSLWRGNMANIIKYVPTFALNYSLKEQYQKMFAIQSLNNSNNGKILINVMSGFLAGGTSLIFVYPFDFALTHLSVDLSKKGNKRNHKGIIDCLVKFYSMDGIRGIYSGFITAFIGISLYRGIVFGFYDSFAQMFPNQKSILVKYLTSVLISGIAGSISLPFDTVRRRLIIQASNSAGKYTGTINCIRSIFKQEGIIGFYRGGLPNFFRSFGSALTLVLNDYVKLVYSKIWR